MIAFIDDHRQASRVEPICRVLPIAPSTYHTHVARRADPSRLPDRIRRDADLKVEIRRVFEENFRVYGVRKIWRQLRRKGLSVARCTVARLMRDMGVRGAIRGKPLRTTISDKAAPRPLDHVNRQFHACAPSLAEGLEFRAVVVMGCDESVLPLDERVADAADEAELDDIYETERRLLYVACTRAREHLLLRGVTPTSEYLADFTSDLA